MNTKQNIGESQVTPEIIQKVAPDVVSKSGMSKLGTILEQATKQKAVLDQTLKLVAQGSGADFSSRIKNPETIVQKIATKRLAGRDYKLEDTNDVLGFRMSHDDIKKIPELTKAIEKLADTGAFSILKKQRVKDGNYDAFHLDIKTPNGVKGEIQLMDQQQKAESLANHDLRAIHGENPPKLVAELQDKQAALINKLPNDKASSLAQKIVDIHKATGNKPLSPLVNATLLARAQ